MHRKQRILVTGGAGYVGSILCGRLLDAGYAVTVVDRMLYEQNGLFQYCANPSFTFVGADVRDEASLRPLVARADCIIPLAAIVGAPACAADPVTAAGVNRDAIRLLVRLRGSGQLVVFPNTNSGYGTTPGDTACDEQTPLRPVSLYGRLKCEAEEAVLGEPDTIALRLATVFGMSPRMRLDLLVNHFVYKALTDGSIVIFEKHFRRNYVHVRDVADCFLFCIEHAAAMAGRAYNVGLDDANLSKEELALKVREHVPGFAVHFSDSGADIDKRNYIVSNRRLRDAGFAAARSLDDGIRELVKGLAMIRRLPFTNS